MSPTWRCWSRAWTRPAFRRGACASGSRAASGGGSRWRSARSAGSCARWRRPGGASSSFNPSASPWRTTSSRSWAASRRAHGAGKTEPAPRGRRQHLPRDGPRAGPLQPRLLRDPHDPVGPAPGAALRPAGREDHQGRRPRRDGALRHLDRDLHRGGAGQQGDRAPLALSPAREAARTRGVLPGEVPGALLHPARQRGPHDGGPVLHPPGHGPVGGPASPECGLSDLPGPPARGRPRHVVLEHYVFRARLGVHGRSGDRRPLLRRDQEHARGGSRNPRVADPAPLLCAAELPELRLQGPGGLRGPCLGRRPRLGHPLRPRLFGIRPRDRPPVLPLTGPPMRGAGMPTAAVLLLVLAPAIPWLQTRIDSTLGEFRPQEEALYLQSGKHVKMIAPGFEGIAADVYWVRTVQYFGGRRSFSADKNFALLYPLIDITTTLDPRLEIAYRYGAIFLSEPPPVGAGRPRAGGPGAPRFLVASPGHGLLLLPLSEGRGEGVGGPDRGLQDPGRGLLAEGDGG